MSSKVFVYNQSMGLKKSLKGMYLIRLLIPCLSILLVTSCKTDKKMNIPKFKWEESKTTAPGYPMEVYRGGLKGADGSFRSLYGGISTGKHGWGSVGGGWGSAIQSLPNGLHVKWVSFAEDCVYEIDTPINYDKILALFKKGYRIPLSNFRPPLKSNFNVINVGFAPGGVVFIWAKGIGRQIEIGRYQGHKITVPQAEIDQLDHSDKIMFTKERRESIMKEKNIIPLEIQKANKNKPIPFGYWDSIRKRYTWKIQLELPSHIKDKRIRNFFFNGEKEFLFGKEQMERFQIEEILRGDESRERAIPRRIILDWVDKDNVLTGCSMVFNEKEIFKAFQEVFNNTNEGEAIINIRVNEIETNAAVQIIGNGKKVWLPSTKIKVVK